MAGITGIMAFDDAWKISRFLYYSMLAIQNRGQEYCFIGTSNGKNIYKKDYEGMIDENFRDIDLANLKGHFGLGCVCERLTKPIMQENLIIAYDGLPKFNRNDLKSLTEAKDKEDAVKEFVSGIGGAYSMIFLFKDCMFATRDCYGLKPMVVGGLGFDLGIVASESSCFDVLGADLARDVKPGELLYFDLYTYESLGKCKNCKMRAFCSFEYVYFARPDSKINNKEVYEVRCNIGKQLAKESPAEADVVIGVPETALPFAFAYANELGLDIEMGFVRTGKQVRTAIRPSEFERIVGVQLKLNPIRSAVRGKRVVLIDDSVVRGTTLRNTVYHLKRKGAKEVHVRIGSPHIIAKCPFGMEVPSEDELIAKDNTEEEIAAIIGADSFAYLSIDGLVKAIGFKKDELCLGCFTGRYPSVK